MIFFEIIFGIQQRKS